MPNVLVGRYEIIEELGQGGMGVVYRARDRQLSRDVAIKLVHTTGADSETLAARLMREAQALAQLSHPNVVAVYDVGRSLDGVFVAMELISGVAADIWLNDKKPPWPEVLRVFLDAARGLAAAHAVGLIHRDFKPANLILGSDGRVRVLDFGLARTTTYTSSSSTRSSPSSPDIDVESTPNHDDLEDRVTEKLGASNEAVRSLDPSARDSAKRESVSPVPSRSSFSPSLLDSPLTELGAIVGTPPYMAPEQHMRAPCDARTDQFSFCVSLYRALYAQRPFEGKRYPELKKNILAGNVKPPPANTTVPSWLHDIVLRGLAVDPAKRWPSMDALIAALSRDRHAKTRKIIAGAAVLALASAGAAAWHFTRTDPAAACAVTDRDLAGTWDAASKQRLRTAFTKTGKPYAEGALTSVSRTLDDYTSRWAKMRTDACLATRVRGTQSAELLDLRMECLQRRLDGVRALVDVLATADADVVTNAAQAAASLPALDACADAEALRAPIRPPSDPKIAARVDVAHKTTAKARALWMAGRYGAAQKLIAPVISEAKAIGYRPLEGETLLLGARIADSSSDYTAASTLYKEAAIAAEAGRDDETAALARNGLVWVVGERLGRYDEAKELARDAEAKIERLNHSELLQADLDQKLAALYLEQGDYKEAERRGQRVLAIRQRVLAADDPAIAAALGDLGDVGVQTMRYDEAIDYYKRALAIAERANPEHPFVGTMRINLAGALRGKSLNREALVELQKARAISERSLGPDHTQLATIALGVGGIELEQGNDVDAAIEFRKARDIWTRAGGADHPNVATAEFRLGEVALKQGRPAEAATAFQHAYDIWRAKLGPEHPSLAAALTALGDVALAQKQPAAALGHYTRALALLEKAMGADSPVLADTLNSLANAQLALGKSKLAVASLERALKLREGEGDKLAIARAQWALARALPASESARAGTLARSAHDTLAAAPDAAKEAEPIDSWLRGHAK
ncbi:MAG TPA: serine/threonine-protein kinase [Kofleriaceae bacterium]